MRKLTKSTFPTNHSEDDFHIDNPKVAEKDGEFEQTNIADLGCYNDQGVMSNKYYHACICSSKINGSWYVYFEWGRTNQTKSPQFQFIECLNEYDAQSQYCKQLNSKNVRRGIWVNSPIGKVLQARPKKDCYLVRCQKTRSVGLPCARQIEEKSSRFNVKESLDQQTVKLLEDLVGGTTKYAHSILSSKNIPSLSAINEARLICDEATKITNKLRAEEWEDSHELSQLTKVLYSRIPKAVQKGERIILSPEVVAKWVSDLDAFESISDSSGSPTNFSLANLNLRKLKFVPVGETKGNWIYDWFPKATRNRHAYLNKSFKIKNLWFVERIGDVDRLTQYQKEIGKCSTLHVNEVLHQPDRKDIFDKSLYESTNTMFLIHGTRSVNVKGLLEKSFLLPKELSRAQITGSLFSPGVYCADDYKKSIGYTSYRGSYWAGGSGSITGRSAFMFLCDVVLGNMRLVKYGDTKGADGKNFHSVFAKAQYSGIQNNEFVLSNVNGIRIRYLVEI